MSVSDAAEGSLQTQGKLAEHFGKSDFKGHPELWDKLWETQECLPWDRKKPSPALVDALKERKDLFGDFQTGSRKKALIPGCGRGYDVLFMAELGFDAVGMDISENSVAAAREFAKSTNDYDIKTGTYKFLNGDFFQNDWLESAGTSPERGFDLIYDYTFFCALPPEARPAWSRRMSELLSKDPAARLVCLEFPNTKAPAKKGPPFGVSANTYVAHLSSPGAEIPYAPDGYPEDSSHSAETVDKASKELALTRIAHWQPERTHKEGVGDEMMSVWQHKQ